MKVWLPLGGTAMLVAACIGIGPKPVATLILTGDFRGVLSPCGCTKPMNGGIRRLATAVRQLGTSGKPIVLLNTSLIGGATRQDELKLETLAEAAKSMSGTFAAIGESESSVGPEMLDSAQRLSGGVFRSAVDSNSEPQEAVASGPFMIVAARPDSGAALQSVRIQAESRGLKLVVVLDGSRRDAVAMARSTPGISLIQYRSTGSPPLALEMEGSTALATPAEFGKTIVRLSYDGSKFSSYRVVDLAATFADDPEVASIYRRYLRRVDAAGLLEQIPRLPSKAFAGSAACATCHPGAYARWEKSKHSHAYATLVSEGHGRDPDCVPCHVVGLGSKTGFASKSLTPRLANVGCESCHGPSKEHAANPRRSRLGRVSPSSCASCHTTTNSPGFEFRKFWPMIRH